MTTNIFDVDTLPIIAHELRSPIFNINCFLDILYEYNSQLTRLERLESLETMYRETGRLVKLIDALLRIYCINSSILSKIECVNLLEVFIHISRMYLFILQYKRIRFFYTNINVSFYIHGNSDVIEQVLMNLIGNSLKYTFSGKNLLVRIRLVQNISTSITVVHSKHLISLLDNGVGIPKAELFHLQRQIKNSNIKNIIGTGLGISIVKKMLYFHNSTLHVLSRTHKGSLFGFLL